MSARTQQMKISRQDFVWAGRRHLRNFFGVWVLAFVISAALSGSALAQTTVTGRVNLPKSRSTPVVNKRYEVVSKGGVVAMNPPLAVVYVEGNFPRPATAPVASMAQKDLTFVPLLLPVQVGTRVEFPNHDDTYHDVFSYSAPKRFDLGRYLSDEKPVPSQVFDVPGLVTLRCDIHEHMRGLILVLATPHFVVTDAEGRFRIEGVPPGRYVLKAWLDSKTTLERPIDVVAGTPLEVNFP